MVPLQHTVIRVPRYYVTDKEACWIRVTERIFKEVFDEARSLAV